MLRRESKDDDKITYSCCDSSRRIYTYSRSPRPAGFIDHFLCVGVCRLFNYIFRMIVLLCADERTIIGISMVASSVLLALLDLFVARRRRRRRRRRRLVWLRPCTGARMRGCPLLLGSGRLRGAADGQQPLLRGRGTRIHKCNTMARLHADGYHTPWPPLSALVPHHWPAGVSDAFIVLALPLLLRPYIYVRSMATCVRRTYTDRFAV
jgi:hypothetical protein